jgi:exodeoxyribonuclease V alpha subunit
MSKALKKMPNTPTKLNTDNRQTSLSCFDIFSEIKEIDTIARLINENELSFLDCLTIRDILELGDIKDDTAFLAMLLMMFESLQEGSLCLELDKPNLISRFGRRVDTAGAQSLVERFMTALKIGSYNRIIATDPSQYKPMIAATVDGRQLLYFQKYFYHENRLKDHLINLLQAALPPCAPSDNNQFEAIIKEIFSDPLTLRLNPHGKPVTKDPDQIKAIKLALAKPFVIISGGPGTGKTALLVNILRGLWRIGFKPSETLICAPTGRAAQKMTETLRKNFQTISDPDTVDEALVALEAVTIHRALKYRRFSNDFLYGEYNPIPASLVIVDEVSMVDVVLMENLLAAIDPVQTRVIFIGDKNQLPSVEAGAVLTHLTLESDKENIFTEHLALLTTVFRSDRHLQELADAIIKGKIPESIPTAPLGESLKNPSLQWAVIPMTSENGFFQDLILWLNHHYLKGYKSGADRLEREVGLMLNAGKNQGSGLSFAELLERAEGFSAETLVTSDNGSGLLVQLFQVIEAARILTLVRNASFGSERINRISAQFLRSLLDPNGGTKNQYFSGAVIMITRNDYSKSLFNGDIGLVIRVVDGRCRAYFRKAEGFRHFSIASLPDWEPAFAMTVHKSQGSEFDDVLVVLPQDEHHRILSREIVYTAVTRAKKRLFIYGNLMVLKSAVQRKINRQSGLFRLGQELGFKAQNLPDPPIQNKR